MKINSLTSIYNTNIIYKKRPSPNNLERIPNSDWVSFTGKHKRESDDVVKATTFGTQLYKSILDKNTTFSAVKEKLQDYSPDVAVRPMRELENTNTENYRAFSISNLKKDFTMGDKEIFLKLPTNVDDETAKLLFAMEAGHEYTHIKQGENPTVCEKIKQIANGNYEYAKIIMGVGDLLFQPFDNRLQHNTIIHTFNIIDKANMYKYGEIVPRALNVGEGTVFKGLNIKDKKQFEELMNCAFAQAFNEAIKGGLLTNSQIVEHLPSEKQGVEFYKDIRKYCALLAKHEAEAYTTESRIFKKVMNTNSCLNIDVRPIYYNMLAECFEKDNTTKYIK